MANKPPTQLGFGPEMVWSGQGPIGRHPPCIAGYPRVKPS